MEKFLAYIDGLLKRDVGFEILSETNEEKIMTRSILAQYENRYRYEEEFTQLAAMVCPKAWVMTDTFIENGETERIEVRCMIPGPFHLTNELTFTLLCRGEYVPVVKIKKRMINNLGYVTDAIPYQISDEKTEKLITLIKQAIFEQPSYRLLHATGVIV